MSTLALGQQLSDEEVVARVLDGETHLFEIVMRRYNQRLYRAARAILRDDSEAEDVMQDAYVRAYQHLRQFEGRAKFSTWLTRIAVHEALARREKRSRVQELDAMFELQKDTLVTEASPQRSPEQHALGGESAALLEDALQAIPEHYRAVFVLREVEEMSTEETAQALDLTEQNVKVRLHRAKAMLRRALMQKAGAVAPRVFAFDAVRCDRVAAAVFARITA